MKVESEKIFTGGSPNRNHHGVKHCFAGLPDGYLPNVDL